MALEESQLNQIIDNPCESLSLELKDWINPDSPEGKAKIVKAAIAMRNNDGGNLLIGFNNSDGSPSFENAPSNIKELFHIDKIQALISQYASEPFEITIHYPEIDTTNFVVIEIPSGVKTPVATKSGLQDGNNHFLRTDKVIVRSMNSNNTPSTTEAKWKDWPMIIEKCFENREADIGRFLRRHLTSITNEQLGDFFQSINLNKDIDENQSSILDFLDTSLGRFNDLLEERQIILPEHGSMEVTACINGAIAQQSTNGDFLNLLSTTNPRYTGWPVWIDSRSFIEQSSRPFVYQGYWEALIVLLNRGYSDHIDYWRISPEGKFYLYRGLQDDIGGSERSPTPGAALDFALMTLRVAECVVVAVEFAKSLGADNECSVSFAFRWKGLNGRRLCSWANPERMLSYEPEAYQDQVVTEIDIPIDTAKGAFSGYVQRILEPLFQAFNGFEIPKEVTDDLVRKLVERRL